MGKTLRIQMEHPDLTFCREALAGVALAPIAPRMPFSKRWLEYVRDGRIPNPGINRIAELKAFIEVHAELFPRNSPQTSTAQSDQ